MRGMEPAWTLVLICFPTNLVKDTGSEVQAIAIVSNEGFKNLDMALVENKLP